MKTSAIYVLAACAVTSSVIAGQNKFHPMGPSNTRGLVSHGNDLSASMHNPASSSLYFTDKSGFQTNAFGPFGVGYEVGQVDSLIDELDELVDILEDDDLTADQALDAKDRFDPFLENAAENGMIKASGYINMPFFPMLYKHTDWGTFSFDLSASGSLLSTVLDDEIELIINQDSYQLNTLASLYVKSVGITSFGFGYSKDVWQYKGGTLYTGGKLNINRLSLAKNIIALSGLEDGEDIGDTLKDEFEENSNSSTQLAVDLGLLWVAENYSIGLSVSDVNQPEYEYGSLASDCAGRTGISVDNCFAAQEFIAEGRINAEEVYKANAQGTLEASYWFGDKNRWSIFGSYDLDDKNDALGDLYQWASLGTSAQFDSWLFSEFRVGYSANLSGTELTYYSLGMTFLKYVDLDLRWSDESVEVDGDSGPRSAFLNLGFQTRF